MHTHEDLRDSTKTTWSSQCLNPSYRSRFIHQPVTPYKPCLKPDTYEDTINGIKIIWGPTARSRLPRDADNLGVAEVTLKALTENLLYKSARRIGCGQVNILGAPHEFTTNSSTGDSKKDQDHISGQFSAALQGGLARKGRYKVHVYLANIGVGATAYDNVTVTGERVAQKNKGADTPRSDLSTGDYPHL
ncbi:hypothetical protein SAMD00023353_5100340 [Rosellinia necatrix]|uniref:Uncharacterized protein n=1 Tax=Rosellinia necatrix TaxID=77044 RepID=A0A1W2TR15_ROSNE|nr:hypothetical protein SAMD00023353_5100340 [Rosellinia necatrix]